MARFLLHCVLALSLAFNGIAAPFAMEHRMGPASEHHHEGAAGDVADHAGHHGSQGRHAGHGHQAPDPIIADSDAAPAEPLDRSCCNGTSCQCGCVLPPVVACVTLLMIPQVAAIAPVVAPAGVTVTRATTPPFRPPAV